MKNRKMMRKKTAIFSDLRAILRKERQRVLCSLLIAALVLLSGCTGLGASLESLLSPPKLTEYQTAIYNALIQSTGEQVELTYPRSGDYRSAFVIYNLDDEPTSEAIVFYRLPETSQSEGGLRMSFLDQRDGQWFDLLDRPLTGREVESVSFSDFGMGIDIVVRCSVHSQSEQTVNVLSYDNGNVEELYRGSYVFYESLDMDSDGFNELFLINYDAALGYHTAHLLTYYDDEEGNTLFGAVSTVPLNGDVVTVQRMNRQKLSENDFLVFLDYSKGSGIFGTQLLRCYGKNLTKIFSENMTRRNNIYTPTLYSTDIDGDGRLEIPVTFPLPGYENLTVPEQIYTVEWYCADEERDFTLIRKSSAYISAGLEYMFYIPVRWQGLVTVARSADTVSFVKYDDEAEQLLSVYVQSAGGTAPEGTGWRLYSQTDSLSIYINTYDGEDAMSLTEDELQSCLMLL